MRLLPLYYVNLAILVSIHNNMAKDLPTMLQDIFLMGTATFHFVPWMWFPRFNGVLWSIGSEIWFCVLMPGILWAIGRFGLLRTLLPIMVLSVCMQFWGTHTIGAGANYISDNVLGDALYFSMGMFAAYVHVRHRIRQPLLLCLAGFLMIGTAFVLEDQITVGAWRFPVWYFPIINTMFAAGSTTIMLGLVHTKNTMLRYVFGNRPLQLIGMMSYSLYVWHPSVIPMYMIQMTPLNLLRMAIVLFILCWLSYRYIEFGRVSDVRALLPRKPRPTDDTIPIPAS